MSSYLSFKVGRAEAMLLMAAHEDSEFSTSNNMDYYNDERGFNAGAFIRQKYAGRNLLLRETKVFLDEMISEVQRRHKTFRGGVVRISWF